MHFLLSGPIVYAQGRIARRFIRERFIKENDLMIFKILQMKSIHCASILVSLLGAATAAQAASPFVVTASNAAANQLLVYSPSGELIQKLSTNGKGGATGNSGGVQSHNGLVAAVNFGSQSVAIFKVGNKGLSLSQVVSTVANPVSVAFGENHLYVLGAEKVESHSIPATM
jgi:hypothetical protein